MRNYALMLLIVLITSCRQNDFKSLIKHRANTDVSEPIAKRLMLTEVGLEKSINDLSVFGGKTRGWSTWILINSPKKEKVTNDLKDKLNKLEKVSFRIEAYWVLWNLEKTNNHIISLFKLVHKAGGAEIQSGRGKLMKTIADKHPSLIDLVLKPSKDDLDLTLDLLKDKLNSTK
ncbi:MAG: hypothetical protein NE334_20420 [Lentisphaeraceae bacterium]|nr:hypothetical protein [Lentisphaeraceae bacterium]